MSAYSLLADEFLSANFKSEHESIYERFYYWMIDEKGLSTERAEGEVATFMETVADLMD